MNISELRKRYNEDYGIDISAERLRRLERMGIITSTRNEANYRVYDSYNEIKKVLHCVEIGVPLGVLKNKDVESIVERIVSIYKVMEEL